MLSRKELARDLGLVAICLLTLYLLVTAGCAPARAADSRVPTTVVHDYPPNRFSCNLTSTSTTSVVVTGCTAPGAGLARYLTDMRVGGGVATGLTTGAVLQYGTGSSCGTGTTVVWRCNHGATSDCADNMTTPIKIGANTDLCLLDGATGTKLVTVSGFIAP